MKGARPVRGRAWVSNYPIWMGRLGPILQYTAETFLLFLRKVITHYPIGKIVLKLDNARIHHAKLLEPFLAEMKSRLELVFLPPHSPQFNIVEGLWKWLKADVINNVFCHTVADIRKNVKAFMEEISKDKWNIIDRLCVRLEPSLRKRSKRKIIS